MSDIYNTPSKIKLIFSLLLVSFSLTACEDTPKSPASGDNRDRRLEQVVPGDDSDIKVKAVKFSGKDFMGRSCNLYLGLLEEDHNKDGDEHNHHIAVKVDYATRDGHKPMDSEAVLYQYDEITNTYMDADQATNDSSLVLLSAALKDESEADPNSLSDYQSNYELVQSIRINFSENDIADDYLENLEAALEAQDSTSVDLSPLNKIDNIVMTLLHGDHYHNEFCRKQTAVEIVTTTFEMDGHHHDEEDDHDHGDDHDHDHDHE